MEGWVGVGKPEKNQLLQSNLAVGHAGTGTSEPLHRCLPAPIHRDRGKLPGKTKQSSIQLFFAYARLEPRQRRTHYCWIALPAVECEDSVYRLIDQPHRVQGPRMHFL